MLQLIIGAIAPQLFDSVVKRASCFRTIIVKLPPNIEGYDLIQYLGSNLETVPYWNILSTEKIASSDFETFDFSGKYNNRIGNDWTVKIWSNNRGRWLINWPQYVYLVFKELSESEKYLVIHSHFVKAQLVERGYLENNLSKSIEIINAYLAVNGYKEVGQSDILYYYADKASKINKNISPSIAIVAILTVFLISCAIIYYVINF